MTLAPVSKRAQPRPSAPPLAKPHSPWGHSLGLDGGCCSLDSLAGTGPELVLGDQLQRKPSLERPRPPPLFRGWHSLCPWPFL